MLRIHVYVNDELVAEASAANIELVSMQGYDVTAVTHDSKDGSHGRHEFELGHRNGDQTVWRLVEEIARVVALRENVEAC